MREKRIDIKLIEKKINKGIILLFDMDDTLIETNFANFLSYKKAILIVKKSINDITFNPNERFNRSTLKTSVPDLSDLEIENIIQLKEKIYKEFLPSTSLNKIVAEILYKYSGMNQSVLVTNCREDRAFETLKYHGLIDKFSKMYFSKFGKNGETVNKFQNAITELKVTPTCVIVFENELVEIEGAQKAGIPLENIIIIKP